MSANSAEALVAKLNSDSNFAAQFRAAKNETAFLEVAKKEGYDVTLADFTTAVAAFKKSPKGKKLSEKQLEQVSAGLSIVGVDYAFVAVETSQG